MNAPLPQDWTLANQQLLVAEFERLKERLRLPSAAASAATTGGAEKIAAARQAIRGESAIDWLCTAFGLSEFESDLLLLCAGTEMDADLARICAEAQGDPLRPWPTFGLALAALASPHWSALTPQRPLRRWRLLDLDDRMGLSAGRLRIDERVLHFLVGINELEPRLAHLLRPARALPRQAGMHADTTHEVVATLKSARENGALPVIVFEGDDPAAHEDIAARVAEALGLNCLSIQSADIPANAEERAALITLWQREATLLGTALLVILDNAADHAANAFLERVGGVCLVSSQTAPSLHAGTRRFTVDKPSSHDRRQLWMDSLGPNNTLHASAELEQAASHFRLGSRAVQEIARTLSADMAVPKGAKAPVTSAASLWNGCRQESRAAMENLAQRIETKADWDALILPEAQLAVLRQIAAQLRQRFKVQEEWGFANKGNRGLGLATLFAGESGTGKTLAAEVLAHTLQLDLYRIDLSAMVSKYIGETEKNLRKVFDAAENCGAILLFDEADALFGKRTEVKDSHDRYANIEVSYLLQRMEAYHGLAILTTNLKSGIDTAFLRRLRFVVQFPFPDQPQRSALWQRAFPPATPTRELDLDKLSRLSMTGGSIRNIALNAAFLAADDGEPVGMKHLLQAAHTEASKRDRPLADAETRGWA
ncbi:MAG: family ATPase [Proteobacteria bacterium]|nr:family ATPase [Pseudomonadota bacterium]